MKKTYQEPATEIVVFEAADIITTSTVISGFGGDSAFGVSTGSGNGGWGGGGPRPGGGDHWGGGHHGGGPGGWH